MSIPSINDTVIQVFSNAHDQDSYISRSLLLTKDKEKSAPLEEVSVLAEIAITRLKQQIDAETESREKIQAQARAVKDYLIKELQGQTQSGEVDRVPAVTEITHQVFSKLFIAVQAEIRELTEIEDSLDEKDLRIFSDNDLKAIAQKEDYLDFRKYGIKSGETKIRLAIQVAHWDTMRISLDIKKYGIKNQEALIEIAKLTLGQDASCSEYIQNFGIKDPNALIDIAKLAAQQSGSALSGNIQKFGIVNPNALFEIAKLALQQKGTETSMYIQNYGIKDQDALVEIAQIAAGTDSWFSKCIQNYGIKDPDVLIKLARAAAQFSGGSVSEYICNYGIKNEKTLIEVAKLAAQNNGGGTSAHIQNYGIENPESLIEIAKLAAKDWGAGTSEHIKNYGITKQAALIEIAKQAAQHWRTSCFIQNYGIKDQESLIEIAKLTAQRDGEWTSQSINNYGININNQEALIEIAKLAVQQNGSETSKYIRNYGIDSEEALIEIAKLAAQQPGGGVSAHIHNYGIRNEGALIEIAKLAAQQQGDEISEDIKNYGIRNKEALIEIAKLAAQQNGSGTSEHIQQYDIKNEKALIEIAKLAVQQDGMKTSSWIQNYGIESEEALIEIAKLAAQQNGTSAYIQVYGIKNPAALIEIAKIAAQNDGRGNSQHITNYNIESQEVLIEIAKLSARQNGVVTSYFIGRYDIIKDVDRLKIFFIAFKYNPMICCGLKKNYNLSCSKEVNDLTEHSTLSEIQKAFPWPKEFAAVFKEFAQETPNQEDILFLIYLGFQFLNKPPHLNDSKMWSSILNYRDKKMRYELVDAAFALDEKQAKNYAEMSSPDFLRLPALFLCLSSKIDEDFTEYHDVLKDKREFRDGMLLKVLLDALHPLIVEYHFNPKEVTHLLKTALVGNIKANLLSIQGILACGGEDFLRKEAQDIKIKPNLDAAYQAAFTRAIPLKPIKDFSTKYAEKFGNCALPSAPLTYAGRLRRLPKKEREIALSALGTFIHSVLEDDYLKNRYKRFDQLDKESDHMRIIFDKKPSLEKDWPIPVKKSLEEYFTTPSKFSFQPQNFLKTKILNDKHLSPEKYPDFYHYLATGEEKIADGLTRTIQEFAKNAKGKLEQTKSLGNALDILKDIEKIDKVEERLKLIKKAAKKLNKLVVFAEICKGIESIPPPPRGEAQKVEDPVRIQTVQDYMEKLTKLAKGELIKLSIPDQERQKFELQKNLIDLWKSEKKTPPFTMHQQMNLLKKIYEGLEGTGEEFLNDVKGIIEAAGKQKQSFVEYTIVNTDQFDDMLLCGTQVQGSCQRIDGDPKLNKCLLAYILDGKNRLVAIKDKEGNIVARSIVRILWDKNNNCPALMQERVYSNILDDNLKDALNKFTKDEATRLGVALYRQSEAGNANLVSFGSIAPWEYVDSAGGVHANGKFTITSAQAA